MRELAQVHREVLAAIPDAGLRQELAETCAATIQSYHYSAPELVPALWAAWCHDLESVLGHDMAARPWIADVQKIVNGR